MGQENIEICLNNQQGDGRGDRLMAIIYHPAETEKVDLGYPEEAKGKINSMRWRNHILSGVLTGVPLFLIASGVKLMNGPDGTPYLSVFVVTTEAVSLLFIIHQATSWARKADRINKIGHTLSDKIKTVFLDQLAPQPIVKEDKKEPAEEK